MKLYFLYLDYHQTYNSVYLDFLYILLFLNIKICRLENGLSFEAFVISVVTRYDSSISLLLLLLDNSNLSCYYLCSNSYTVT